MLSTFDAASFRIKIHGFVRIARAISDAGWGKYRRQLEYKDRWYGTQVVAIDRFFPSSKTYSACGHVMPEMPLSIREWVCPDCGAYHERDLNAAVNIKNEALRRAGIARIHTGGESVRPILSWQFSQKPEKPNAFTVLLIQASTGRLG